MRAARNPFRKSLPESALAVQTPVEKTNQKKPPPEGREVENQAFVGSSNWQSSSPIVLARPDSAAALRPYSYRYPSAEWAIHCNQRSAWIGLPARTHTGGSGQRQYFRPSGARYSTGIPRK